jgi:hypothetical protein
MDDEESDHHEEENHESQVLIDREETPLLVRRASDAGVLSSMIGDVPSEVSSTVRRRRLRQSMRNSSRPQLGASM